MYDAVCVLLAGASAALERSFQATVSGVGCCALCIKLATTTPTWLVSTLQRLLCCERGPDAGQQGNIAAALCELPRNVLALMRCPARMPSAAIMRNAVANLQLACRRWP